jgi:hypothetical protein
MKGASPLPSSFPGGPLCRRVLGAGLRLLGLLLVAFHGWLLARRLLDATVAEPAVLLRWLGAVALLGGALLARRRGLSLLSGRSGLVFWLLVLVLHVGASPVVVHGVRPQELLLVLPVGLLAGLGAAARSGRVPPLRFRAPRQRPARLGWLELASPSPHQVLGALPERFSPRPPPLAVAIA